MKTSKEQLKALVIAEIKEQTSKYRKPEEDQDYWGLSLEPNEKGLAPQEDFNQSINRLRDLADRMEKVLKIGSTRMVPGTGSPGDVYEKEIAEALLSLKKFVRKVEYEAKDLMMEWP